MCAYRLYTSNHKGGAGKTGEEIGLAYALARKGYRVGFVDMDPQGNGTRRLGVSDARAAELVADGNLGIAGVLDPDNPVPIEKVAVPCGWDDPAAEQIIVVPSLLPATLERRAKESGEPGSTNRLRRALDDWDADLHFTLIDGGPGLNHLFDNCLAATDWILLVVDAEFDGVRGATRVVQYVDKNKDKLGRDDLIVVGVVINGYDDTSTHRTNRENLPVVLPGIDPWEEVRAWSVWSAAMNDAVPPSAITHPAGRRLEAVFAAHADRVIALGSAA